jgi:hypothetical protein
MFIGDTLTRVIIVIEHPQIQLAFIIPIYIKQVVIIRLTVIMSILELIVTGLYHIIVSLSLALCLYYILSSMHTYIYILLYY